MRLMTALLAAASLLAVSACDGPAEDDDAGIVMDARAPEDAGLPDSGSPELDAGPPVDPDAGTDAGPPDTDGDGVPDALDCDPDDDTIGESATRDCSTACGPGTEECTDGTWGECSAPTDCLCETEGERRLVTCGMCGEQSEECMDGTWQPVSECLSEGECAPGDVERWERFYCRVDERLCRSDCSWGDWTTVEPAGECNPGSRTCDATTGLDRLCNAMCMYEDDPTCPVNP